MHVQVQHAVRVWEYVHCVFACRGPRWAIQTTNRPLWGAQWLKTIGIWMNWCDMCINSCLSVGSRVWRWKKEKKWTKKRREWGWGGGARQSLGKSNQSKCNSLSFTDECLGGFIYYTTILKMKTAGMCWMYKKKEQNYLLLFQFFLLVTPDKSSCLLKHQFPPKINEVFISSRLNTIFREPRMEQINVLNIHKKIWQLFC